MIESKFVTNCRLFFVSPHLPHHRIFFTFLFSVFLGIALQATEFSIEAGDAEQMLRVFSQQAQREIIYPVELVRGIQIVPISGEMDPLDALKSMLHGTGLQVFEDRKTKALALIHIQTDTDAPRDDSSGKIPEQVRKSKGKLPTYDMDEFVVTGVFEGVSRQEAGIAISIISKDKIRSVIPSSAAEVLEVVPGVFVNSALGEIRNVVYSRGVSANSIDGAEGYYYVSMQEDGLPVISVFYNNFVPDYFLRVDSMIEELEAVRGGISSILAANAPGGIFNYINQTGGEVFEERWSLRYGLEGDGKNPFMRTDLTFGGPLGRDWFYQVGGFYRNSRGARNPGYPVNQGGQVKANLVKKLENGRLQLYFKYLDDRNGWYEFVPATNFNNPQFVEGFSNTSSVFLAKDSFEYPTGENQTRTFDPTDLVENKSLVFGVKFKLELGNDWSLRNHFKCSDNQSEWNVGALVFPQELTNKFTYYFLDTYNINGTYTFADHETGTSARILQSDPGVYTILENNLPGGALLSHMCLAQFAIHRESCSQEIIDQFLLTKRMDQLSVIAGSYLAFSNVQMNTQAIGGGIGTMTPSPRLLDVSLQTVEGETLQITNPYGYTSPNSYGGDHEVDWLQLAIFGGLRWTPSDNWIVDAGLRHDYIQIQSNLSTDGYLVVLENGGIDGVEQTLYDNVYGVAEPTVEIKRFTKNTTFSAAISHIINKNNSIYARYSNGAKAPDLTYYFELSNPSKNETQEATVQRIQQFEIGYTLQKKRISLSVTPFYSLLSNIPLFTYFTDLNGTTYSRLTLNEMRSIGIEFEGRMFWGSLFEISTSLTWQDAVASKQRSWIANDIGRDDDEYVDYSGNDAANNPDFMAMIETQFSSPTGRFKSSLQWKYLADRPANNANAFNLPAFSEFDFMASLRISNSILLSMNIKNLFNKQGIMFYGAPGGFTEALNRQGLTREWVEGNPNAIFSVVTSQPRAYFLTLTYQF